MAATVTVGGGKSKPFSVQNGLYARLSLSVYFVLWNID